jgi:hypothetical protein
MKRLGPLSPSDILQSAIVENPIKRAAMTQEANEIPAISFSWQTVAKESRRVTAFADGYFGPVRL